MHIAAISSVDVLPLRHEILRADFPPEEAVFPHDDDPGTVHLGAFLRDQLVGVASVYPEPPPGQTDVGVWRLRGMAVAAKCQRQGIGGALLRACLAAVRERGGRMLWCNARDTAVPFYRKHGWVTVGEKFSIPTVGPHCRMQVQVSSDS